MREVIFKVGDRVEFHWNTFGTVIELSKPYNKDNYKEVGVIVKLDDGSIERNFNGNAYKKVYSTTRKLPTWF